jgi:hypothetical protein
MTKPNATVFGLCPYADGKADGKIQSARYKLEVSIRKACAGADKVFGGSGANTDFLPSEIGFAATCAPVDPLAAELAFDGAILTLMDVVTCAARVAGYEVDCADRAAVPWLETYPAECLR